MLYYTTIGTTLKQLNNLSKPLVMAVFLAIIFILIGASGSKKTDGETGVLGGPTPIPPNESGVSNDVALNSQSLIGGSDNASQDPINDFLLANGTLQDGSGPFKSNYQGILTYTVNKSDTLSKIAKHFGVSVQTIVAANPGMKTHALQVGQELNILPISGVLYRVQSGETPESIATTFHLTVNQLEEFNNNVNFNNLSEGTQLIVPGINPLTADNTNPSEGTSNELYLQNYFIQPAEGFNWGILHYNNAVDIANACGTPIVASAEGLIVDESLDYWSGGYGHYVLIEHPNGVKTRYAHMDRVSVSIGDYVQQGQQIGTMGQTGDASGCHVHFEVLGAVNPFVH